MSLVCVETQQLLETNGFLLFFLKNHLSEPEETCQKKTHICDFPYHFGRVAVSSMNFGSTNLPSAPSPLSGNLREADI